VAAGLAEYFLIDPVLTRVAVVVLVFSGGFGILVYIILWIVVPYDYEIGIRKNFAEQFTSKPESNEAANESSSYYASQDYSTGKEKSKNDGTRKVAAIILIVIGSLLLIDNLIIDVVFDNIGPALLVLAGVLILFFAKKKQNKEVL